MYRDVGLEGAFFIIKTNPWLLLATKSYGPFQGLIKLSLKTHLGFLLLLFSVEGCSTTSRLC